MNETVLVVDDDKNLLKVITYNLKEEGYEVYTADSAAEAISFLDSKSADLVLTDVKMPGISGMELLRRVRDKSPETPVILITAYAAIDSAVDAIRQGAVDYVPKPFDKDDLKHKVRRALEQKRLREENARLRAELAQREGMEEMIGRSRAMQEVYELISRVAQSDSTVLITGESGTGKELAARAIHRLSDRREGPLVTVNCAAIPKELLESDLFGHVKGAFTGAVRDQVGKFEQANGGTIFLDEVGDIEIELQPKLLRVLQEREIQRVGSSQVKKVDVRVIAATHADLWRKVQEGGFREDLYYRLAVIPLNMPPLRKRREDIPLLLAHFQKKYGRDKMTWSSKAQEVLERYDWPGNVRELENLVERLSVLHKEKEIEMKHLPENIKRGQKIYSRRPGSESLLQTEKQMIVNALDRAAGNQSEAARILGIPRHALIYRMKKHGIR